MFQNVKIREGHDNFFTPLRLIFAVMVVIGHAMVIGYRDMAGEPRLFFDYTFSYLAVNLFFIASGFLVTKSMLYRKDLVEYSAARIIRIYPGLLVHVLFVMFAMGPFVTNLPIMQFLTDPQFYTQPLQVLSFYETNMVMPGALSSNHEQLGSAPLWTLRFEILAYIGTAVAFALGLLKKNWMLIGQFVIFVTAWPIAHLTGIFEQLPGTGQNILRFGLAYGLGAAIYALRDRLSFNIIGIPVIGLLTALCSQTVMFEPMVNIWLGYIIFWAAYVKIPKLNFLQKMDDISYGVYIYHWCVLQWIFYTNPNMNPWVLLAAAVPFTIALSCASWIWVEKPMLAKKKTLAKFLRFGSKKPKAKIIQPAE